LTQKIVYIKNKHLDHVLTMDVCKLFYFLAFKIVSRCWCFIRPFNGL